MIKKLRRVRIRECGGARKEWLSRHFGCDCEVIDKAVRQHFGQRCFLWRDEGLRDHGIFGQICQPAERVQHCNICVTGRITIDIDYPTFNV